MSLTIVNGSMPSRDQSTTVLLHDLSDLLFSKSGNSVDRNVTRTQYNGELAAAGRQAGFSALASYQPQSVDIARCVFTTNIALSMTDSDTGRTIFGRPMPTQIIFNIDLLNDSAELVAERLSLTHQLVAPAYTAGLPQVGRVWQYFRGNTNILPVEA